MLGYDGQRTRAESILRYIFLMMPYFMLKYDAIRQNESLNMMWWTGCVYDNIEGGFHPIVKKTLTMNVLVDMMCQW